MKNYRLCLILFTSFCFFSCTTNDLVPAPIFSEKSKQFVVEGQRADINGVITPLNMLVDSSKNAIFTIVANSGYIVDAVKVDGQVIVSPSLPTFILFNVVSNKSILVSFRMDKEYTIEATSDANGTITPANQIFTPGKTSEVTITPSAGFTVDVFKVNGVTVPLTSLIYTFFNVNSNQKAEVTFKKDLSWYLCATEWKCDSIYERAIGESYHAWGYFSSSFIKFALEGTYSNSLNGKTVSSGKWSLDKTSNPVVIRWQHAGFGKIELLTERNFVVSYAETYTDIDGSVRDTSEFKEFYTASN